MLTGLANEYSLVVAPVQLDAEHTAQLAIHVYYLQWWGAKNPLVVGSREKFV